VDINILQENSHTQFKLKRSATW